MPLAAVQGAKVRCSHGMGYAKPRASCRFLRSVGKPFLVMTDMPSNSISLCPNYGPTTKPCTVTLPLVSGLSSFVFANGQPIVLDKAIGPTDGVPPGLTVYTVLSPGQSLVRIGG